jgi:hypothetical protein
VGPFSPVLYILTNTTRLRHVRRRRPAAVRRDRALPHRLLRLQALQQCVQHPPDLGHVRVQHLRARVLAQAALENLAQLLRHAIYLAVRACVSDVRQRKREQGQGGPEVDVVGGKGVDGAVELVPDRDVALAVADVRLARLLERPQPQLVLQHPPHRLPRRQPRAPLIGRTGRTGEPWLRERTPASARRGGVYVGSSASTHWSNMIPPER